MFLSFSAQALSVPAATRLFWLQVDSEEDLNISFSLSNKYTDLKKIL